LPVLRALPLERLDIEYLLTPLVLEEFAAAGMPLTDLTVDREASAAAAAVLSRFTRLLTLRLRHSAPPCWVAAAPASLTELDLCDLSDNPFPGRVPDFFLGEQQNEQLHAALCRLPRLRALHLSHMPMAILQEDWLQRLRKQAPPALEAVSLKSMRGTVPGLSALVGQPWLRSLSLQQFGCRIGDALDPLAALGSLTSLHVHLSELCWVRACSSRRRRRFARYAPCASIGCPSRRGRRCRCWSR
jgi:hypothetical protein